jgi:16S rRNA (guanine527-N7)-methyltransferase
MARPDTSERLTDRAAVVGLIVPPELVPRLARYYDALQHWNRTINLTGLRDSEEALDRLLLEPVAAAAHLPVDGPLLDIGSGGGSPAIPLALALQSSFLVMVESRGRKAAFLREMLRQLDVSGRVEERRVEELQGRPDIEGQIAVVSARAIKLDRDASALVRTFLRPNGVVAVFQSTGSPAIFGAGLRLCKSASLVGSSTLQLFEPA